MGIYLISTSSTEIKEVSFTRCNKIPKFITRSAITSTIVLVISASFYAILKKKGERALDLKVQNQRLNLNEFDASSRPFTRNFEAWI